MTARRTVVLMVAIAIGFASLLALVIGRTSSGVAGNGQVADAHARADVLASATSDVTQILSYRSTSFDADVAAADRAMTVSMRGDYRRTVTERLRAEVLAHGIDLHTQVAQAGLISMEPDAAELLMFVDQTTTARDAAATSDRRRVTVNVSRIGGAWLVSNLSYF